MAGESLVYSNARVKAMENSLLTHEKITRMTYAESFEDSVKILYESNYAGGMILDNPYAYEELLRLEDNRVATFMRGAMPKDSGLECFLVRNDYHNAKAMVKSKVSGVDSSDMLMPSGLINIDILRERIQEDNYFSLPKPMQDALKSFHDALEGVSPRMIDVELDRAMYVDIMIRLKSVKAKSIKEYWRANIDLSNISTFIRLKGENMLKQSKLYFIDGGGISRDTLSKIIESPIESLSDKLKFTDYSHVVEQGIIDYKLTKSLVAFEREWDNYLLNIFRKDRHDIFSVAPIAGFYVAKRMEQKDIRLILVCHKNKVDVAQIKRRLRDIYA